MDEDNESTDEIVESGVQRGIRILMKSTEVSKGKTTHHTDCEESNFSIESVKSASALDYQFPFQKKSTSFSEIHPTH